MTAAITTVLTDPVLAATWTSATGLVLRCTLVELRWWLALRRTAPTERPDIIQALRGHRVRP